MELTKQEFTQIVFSRTIPDNFDKILKFEALPRLDKNMRQHNFMSGLICHALDQGQQHSSLIPNRLYNAQFELQHLIRDLSNFFDTFTFRTAYVHPTMLFLRKEFTTVVKQHFLEQQPELFRPVNEWLDNIVTNQQKQRQGQQKKQHRS